MDRAGATVVLVRTNSTRGLKTIRGKRVVPLIERLTDAERSVAEEVMRRLEARPTHADDSTILSDLTADTYKYRRLQIVGRLLRLLKLVTLDATSTLHHARHSFANRVFARLTGRSCGLGSEDQTDAVVCESTRRLLLGRLEIDRRALWALCRLMGHGSPATLVKSYLHVQVVAAMHPAHDVAELSPATGGRYVDLDAQERRLEYLKNLPAPAAHPSPTLPPPKIETLLNYLRLRRIGRPLTNAAWVVGIEPGLGARLEDTLTACAQRLERVHKEDPPLRSGLEMLGRIPMRMFGSLIAAASKALSPTGPWGCVEGVESTVGRSRQILLFQASHFAAASAFVNHFGATARDLALARPAKLNDELLQQIKQNKLDRFLPKLLEDARSPQVDTVLVHRAGDLSAAATALGSASAKRSLLSESSCPFSL